jgi:hypothetical protein
MYFSGLEKRETVQILSRVPNAAGMISYWEYSPNLFAACEEFHVRLAFDSGAYTKPLSIKAIERYANIIRILGARCDFYANADVIGDQRKSEENYQLLLSLLPPELHHLVLWVYQSSAPIRELERGLERFTRIGVGGLVGLSETRRCAVLNSVAPRIAARGRMAHFFGLGQRLHLRMLAKVLDDFSADATTWQVGTKYRRMIHREGYQVDSDKTGFDLAPEDMNVQNARVMQRWLQPPVLKVAKAHECQMTMFE